MFHVLRSGFAYLGVAAVIAWFGQPVRAQSPDPADEALSLFREQKFAEAAEAFGKLAASNPYDGWAWANWGYCLHSVKRYEEAIPRYLKAVELGQNPGGNLYNCACAYSLLGRKDEALATLERALNSRFVEQETLESDTDMDPLRVEPRFAALTGITAGLKEKPAATRDDGWKWDLDFYARRMKQMHWDLHVKVDEGTFRAELDKLKGEIAALNDNQVRARLRKITAMVGDGHTVASFAPVDATTMPRLPIHLYHFKDGLYVIGASAEHANLIGSRVVKVGPLGVEAALAAVRPYISVDNDMGYLDGAPGHLVVPVVLREIAAAPDESGAEFTLATAGEGPRAVQIKPADSPVRWHGGGVFNPNFTYAHHSLKEAPLYLREPAKNLRMEQVPEHKLVYFGFGSIADDPNETLADFTVRLFDTIEKSKAEHLVIDMRFNGGGNTGLIRPLITGLAECKAVNRPGHLWVIIGRRTFSAAQNTVNLMNSFARPTFVGEPTGSRPRFIGESTWFVLPHSKTRVSCSSRYWQVMDSTDDRCWVPPRIVAEMTYSDYASGRDPAMEAIYAAIGPVSPSAPTGAGR